MANTADNLWHNLTTSNKTNKITGHYKAGNTGTEPFNGGTNTNKSSLQPIAKQNQAQPKEQRPTIK